MFEASMPYSSDYELKVLFDSEPQQLPAARPRDPTTVLNTIQGQQPVRQAVCSWRGPQDMLLQMDC
jgi:hypothetical protein